jgi:hypothetical protein
MEGGRPESSGSGDDAQPLERVFRGRRFPQQVRCSGSRPAHPDRSEAM